MSASRPSGRAPSWPAILLTALFVGVTHYVHIAAAAPFAFLVLETSIAVLFVAVGAVAWYRRPASRTGPILVACASLWSLGSYNPAGIDVIWSVAFAFEGYYDVALALLALTFPAERPTGARRTVFALLLGAFLARSMGRLLLSDPPRTYPELFPEGPTNPFAVLETRAGFEAVEVSASVIVLLAVLAIAALAVRRLLASRSLTREVVAPVLVASVVAMAFAAVEAADTAWATAFGASLVDIPEALLPMTDWLVPAGRAVVPLAFLVGTLRLRAPGGPLTALATRLADGEAVEDVDAALVAYIENPELARVLTAQLAELRASRARIVAAADEERRRIERSLHDGAQQHLTAIAMRLEEARQLPGIAPDGLATRLDDTAAELRDAINELRELARGIHPTILTEAGLRPALTTLARRSAVPVDLRVEVGGRLPLATEVTAYYVVAEGLTNVARSAHATRAGVDVTERDGGIAVAVRDDGVGGADPASGSGIAGLRDRVRAVGGRFSLVSRPGSGTTLDVWLPCE